MGRPAVHRFSLPNAEPARSKHVAKLLLQGAGLPTPGFFVVEELPAPPCPIEWPVIVKPALEDASVGLDQGSVVTTQHDLNARVAYLLETYGPPVLVEQFIRGRELNVAVIEAPDLRVLPPSEILFTDTDPGYWPIVTYDAKWKPGSRDYEATPPLYPAAVTPRLREKLETLARKAFRLLGCRDYARIDFRVRTGKPYILEINPNPDFSPLAGMAGGLDLGRANASRLHHSIGGGRPGAGTCPRCRSRRSRLGRAGRGVIAETINPSFFRQHVVGGCVSGPDPAGRYLAVSAAAHELHRRIRQVMEQIVQQRPGLH